MPDLLLEFLSEEIPARMQARAADDLKKMVTDRLVAAGLVYEGAKALATPRRLPPSGPGGAGGAGARAGHQGTEEGPARRRARRRDRRLPQSGRLVVDRRGQGREGCQEGRLLRGGDREAGQAGD